MMEKNWSNWSGSLKVNPSAIKVPESEEELIQVIQQAADNNQKVRVVGAGHSSSPLVATNNVLLSLKHFQGIEAPDLEKCEATVLAGNTIHNAGKDLHEAGLAMHNTGDVDVQSIAGAIGTGTHGTGHQLKNLSTMLIGARLITGTGEVMDVSDDNEELLRALRVALGSCGIFTKLRLKLLPNFDLHRTEWCTHIDDCLDNLDELVSVNRNFDFYWYPRSDLAKLRIMNEPGKGMTDIPYGTLQLEMKGPGNLILPRFRPLKFDEMEYSLPAEAGRECFQEIRTLIKNRFRKEVAWRVLYRTVKADNNMLSTAYERDTVTISLHQNAGLPFWSYFHAIEPVFRRYGGRPHWGKKHTLKAKELQELYPDWENFLQHRRQLDPHGIFLNVHLKSLFGLL